MPAAGDNSSVICSLSPGQTGYAPEGGGLLMKPERKIPPQSCAMITDGAYEGDEKPGLFLGVFSCCAAEKNEKILGRMIRTYTKNATKSRGCSEG